MKTRLLPFVASLIMLALTGCVTQPTATTPTSSAYLLGDRMSVGLDEIVVSLPLKESQAPYQNLHVTLGVIINPVRENLGSSYEVESLVRRLDTRLNATISESLMKLGPQSLATTDELRRKVIAHAQTILSSAVQNWTYAADYRIEVTVLSIYWTDSSVGRQSRGARFGW